MALILALFGMICWGIAPVFGKLGLSQTTPMAGLAMRTFLSASILTVWAARHGTFQQMKEIPLKAIIFLGIEGILATLVGDWAYYGALKYGEVSVVTLVLSCSPVITMLVAGVFLNEQITWLRVIGVLLAMLGLTLVMH